MDVKVSHASNTKQAWCCPCLAVPTLLRPDSSVAADLSCCNPGDTACTSVLQGISSAGAPVIAWDLPEATTGHFGSLTMPLLDWACQLPPQVLTEVTLCTQTSLPVALLPLCSCLQPA